MKAVILAGGQGSRLRPITENIPKPMVSLFGRPMMEHIIRHLMKFGVNEVLTTLHYRPRVIRDHFDDGGELGIQMFYTLENEPLGTAGSVKLGEEHLDETFIIVAGDALVDFDFQAFYDFHKAKGAKVSLCLTRVREPGEFGIVITDDEGRIERFSEKPGPSEVFTDTVNTGIYLIEPEVLAEIPEGEAYDFASDLFPALLEQGVPMYGYVAEGYWSDIGTLEQLKQAHNDMLDGKVDLTLPGNQVRPGVWLGNGCEIAEDAIIEAPCWIGNDVQVKRGARIGPYSVLSDNVEVDRFASVMRTIVLRNSFIGEASDLRNSLVASRNIIEARCELNDGVVLGGGCRLGQGVIINPGVLIWPDKEVDSDSTVKENLVWESLRRPSIFGSRGVSGLANLHITPEFAATLGKSFGNWVHKGARVSVSRDGHPFSRMIKRALVSGLMSVGVNVEDLEWSSTPITRYLTTYGPEIDGGIHVRISDEHPNVGQIELFTGDGLPIRRSVRRKIEATFARADFPKVSISQVGRIAYPGRVYERYLEHLLERLNLASIALLRERVVYYCDDERTATMIGTLLSRSGVAYLQYGSGPSWKDGDERVAPVAAIAEVARQNHGIGLVVSGNGEHFQLIDDTGNLHSTQRTEELLTAAFIMSGSPEEPVFLAPDHPFAMADLARRKGREVVLTRKEPAPRLAEVAEQQRSGDWLDFNHYYLGFDAVAGVMRLLEFLGSTEQVLRDFERQIPTGARDQLSLPCGWDDMGRVMRELNQHREADNEAIPEGVQLRFDEGLVYVWPSSDAPRLEVTVEAYAAHHQNDFLARVKRELGRLVQ